MDPWSPSQHGVVESRHQIFTDVADFPFEDGAGGEWPIKAPEPKFPGGISTTGGGTIDFWETDMDNVHKVRKRDWEASFVSAQETALARNVSVSEHKNA